MGLLDNLVRKKTPVEKAQKDLTEPYAQPDVRRAAMNKLLEIGTEEAYDALLKRFTFNSHGNIADEEEKRDLIEELGRVGHAAVPSLKRFISNEKQIGFPITALSKILPKAEVVEFLIGALKSREPLDHRSTESKRALIIALTDRSGPELALVIAPYLDDHHDDVQFHAVEALERLKNPATAAALAAVCKGDTHSARIQRRAALALSVLEWAALDYEEWNPELKDEYVVGTKGAPVKRSASRANFGARSE
ncbi:MAG: HEAT repeat domain-containing protein [Deltaproteobacteria bacterium]|nr:HEAT repeat domain-containing protein [Deltaproteobacteria bacterium]